MFLDQVELPLFAEGAYPDDATKCFKAPVGGVSATGWPHIWLPLNEWWLHAPYLTIVISVPGCVGTAPSAWSLSARPIRMIPHTHDYMGQQPIITTWETKQLESHILEGVGFYGETNHSAPTLGSDFGVIANQADGLATGLSIPGPGTDTRPTSTRVTVSRTFRNMGFPLGFEVLPAITGGDSTTGILATGFAKAHQ